MQSCQADPRCGLGAVDGRNRSARLVNSTGEPRSGGPVTEQGVMLALGAGLCVVANRRRRMP
ncbi:MAG: hypothetical protein C4340_01740 [Armatimonadota bacterium]